MDLCTIADKIFQKYNIYDGEGERNHCLRLIEFALLHRKKMQVSFDDNLLYLAAMLHDLGLMVPITKGSDYLSRSVDIAHHELDSLGFDEKTWESLEFCLLYNHSIKPQKKLDALSEAFRRAVFTEHTRGVHRFGLPRREVKAVFRAIPYDNFAKVLADFIWKTTVYEPKTLPKIFFS